MDKDEIIQSAIKNIFAPDVYSFDDRYYSAFIKPKRFAELLDNLSIIRRNKIFTVSEFHYASYLFRHYANHYNKFQEKLRNEPRKYAQQFIGKRNVREFIFNRDGHRCLRCGTDMRLTIDHIISIYHGGENKLSNLQTLCRSCNSWKGVKFIDFR